MLKMIFKSCLYIKIGFAKRIQICYVIKNRKLLGNMSDFLQIISNSSLGRLPDLSWLSCFQEQK